MVLRRARNESPASFENLPHFAVANDVLSRGDVIAYLPFLFEPAHHGEDFRKLVSVGAKREALPIKRRRRKASSLSTT
jgi:hypothetical protein